MLRDLNTKHFRFFLLQIQQKQSPSGRLQLERKKEAKHILKSHWSSEKAKYALTYKFNNKYNTNHSELNELSTKLRISMRSLKDNIVKSWIHSVGIAQAWENSFGNLSEMKKSLRLEEKKINNMIYCPAGNCRVISQ